MTEPAGWRLIIDPEARGAWNMAVDEAILERYAGPDAPDEPTLRLYGFHPATLSLGRLQDAAASHSPDALREEGIDLVRRPTGGNAVLHRLERTYSLIGLLRRAPFEGGVVETYRRIADCLADALRQMGAAVEIGPAAPRESRRRRRSEPACFALLSSHEITHAGRKLVGSAQLRRRGAFLQHGSIPLRADAALLSHALGARATDMGVTDLERATGGPVEADRLDDAIVAAFRKQFGVGLCRGVLSVAEADRATGLYAWKYCSTAWTYEGRVGTRESAHGPL